MNKNNNPTLFSENETKYLFDNRLGRLATVSSDNQPHVVLFHIILMEQICFLEAGILSIV